jgi:hypothetical protein
MSLTIYLTPLDVEQRLSKIGISCVFTPEEHAGYATTPVVENQDGTILAFPTPSLRENLTLGNIKKIVGTDPKHQPSIFEHSWYENEDFMTMPCPPGWHLLRTEPLPSSILQQPNYLRSSGNLGMNLPLAVEVVLMLFLHYAGSGEQLLGKKHTWCADSASSGRQVTVGAFGKNGVFLSAHPPNFSSRGLGICPRITPIFSEQPEFG